MTEEFANLILRQLRPIEESLVRTGVEISELKGRASLLAWKTGMIVVSLEAMTRRMDCFDARLARVERRIDLIEA